MKKPAMRPWLFCLAMLAGGAALAEDLNEVNKLLDAKSYPQAMAMLTRLADAGNPSAQLRLGQMHCSPGPRRPATRMPRERLA
jgi:hypothetical protein